MMSQAGVKAVIGGGGGEGFNKDEVERGLNVYRSGSAPPTVEGSLSAIGGLFSGDISSGRRLTEEELRSDPAYLSYYYSKVKLNPRLPPPAMSKEGWHFSQRCHSGSSVLCGIGDERKVDRVEEGESTSLFSMQPGFVMKKEGGKEDSRQAPGSGEWLGRGGDGLIGLPGLSVGRQRTFADLFQNDQGGKSCISSQPSRLTSRKSFDSSVELLRSGEACVINQNVGSLDGLQASDNAEQIFGAQNGTALPPPTIETLIGSSISRSYSPDPQLAARGPSPHVPPIGVNTCNNDPENVLNYLDTVSSGLVDDDNDVIIAALSRVNLSGVDEDTTNQSSVQKEADKSESPHFTKHDSKYHINKLPFLPKNDPGQECASFATQSSYSSFPDLRSNSSALGDFSKLGKRPHKQVLMQRSLSYNNSYRNIPPVSIENSIGSRVCYPSNADESNRSLTSYGLNGYSMNALDSGMGNHVGTSNLPPLFESAAAASGFGSGVNWNPIGLQHINSIGCQTPTSALHIPLLDPLYLQYLTAVQAATNCRESTLEMASMGNSYAELLEMQKIYLGALLQQQKQLNLPSLGKSGYYGNAAFNHGMQYSCSPLASPVLPSSSVGPSSPLRHGVQNINFSPSMRNFCGNFMDSWHLDNGTHMNNDYSSSLLEEFKNNKTKCYELSDISGHVVEFRQVETKNSPFSKPYLFWGTHFEGHSSKTGSIIVDTC